MKQAGFPAQESVMADGEKVYLYTAPECDVCDKARAGLRAEGVDFEERDVMKNKEWFDFVVKHTIFVPLVVRGDAIEIGWKGAYG
jgi:glutaredoxin